MYKELMKNNEGRCEKFLQLLKKDVFEAEHLLSAVYSQTKDFVKYEDRQKLAYKSIKEGDLWGTPWESAWFNVTGSVPKEWKGKEVMLKLDFGSELMIFDNTGTPVYALTVACVFDPDYVKTTYPIFNQCKGGEKVDIWIEGACNVLFGLDLYPDPKREQADKHGVFNGKIKELKIAAFDRKVWDLYMDIEVLLSLTKVLPENSPRRKKILAGINKANDLYLENRKNVQKSRAVIKELMNKKANASALEAVCIGHAHMDTAWLWPVKETIRKTARTFASQLDLIKRYPGYVFGASQPQIFEFIKIHYPTLYAKVKDAVKKGSFELQGGMWVEPDCNLISGESMVRQLLYGKNYFMDEFGKEVKNLWLPDVFGYSAALPQILKKAGVDYFMTQKISWSQYNLFPHHTFNWTGIDGTTIMTHFLPANTYNSNMTPADMYRAEERFSENDTLDKFLVLFGIGDGGGGPKEEYIERGLRQQSLEGVPKVKFAKAEEYFKYLEDKAPILHKWVGELYLELHRGTLTTQAKVKRGNRKLENKLKAIEFVLSNLPFKKYPQEKLDYVWKKLLINQFHDILPGSSIAKVYETTLPEYRECDKILDKLLDDAAVHMFEKSKDSAVVFNPLSSTAIDIIELPADFLEYQILDSKGKEISSQHESNNVLIKIPIEPNGYAEVAKGKKIKAKSSKPAKKKLILENDLVTYKFNENGQIVHAFDKEDGREILVKGNILSFYNDRPVNWDAWDVDIYYQNEKITDLKAYEANVIANGPIRSGLQFKSKISNSEIVQNVYLESNSKKLDFQTSVKWNERHKMLRVSFETTIETTEASFDIQYGYIKRPTHNNTSWDLAKFEVPGHKYADLSTYDYGVALMNDCKYGYKVKGSTLDLNILRSPTNPDPDTDMGEHELVYSLYPHKGNLISSDIIEASFRLNNPPVVFNDYKLKKEPEQICRLMEHNGISLEVLKKSHKEDSHIIRFVELKGKESTGKIRFSKPVTLVETNLIEWEDKKILKNVNDLDLCMKPFEIKTFKVK